jgi:hypothetical protein
MLAGLAEIWPPVIPLPDKPTLRVDVDDDDDDHLLERFQRPRLLLADVNPNDTLPLAVPVVWGEYTTATCVLPPADSVRGRVSPLKEKTELLTFA